MPKPRPKYFLNFTHYLEGAAEELVERYPEMSFHEAYMRFYEALEWADPEMLVLGEVFNDFLDTLVVDEVETELLHERTGIERFPATNK